MLGYVGHSPEALPVFYLSQDEQTRLKAAQEILSQALKARLLPFNVENDLVETLRCIERLLESYILVENSIEELKGE